MLDAMKIFSALASEPRLQVINWLKDPVTHFSKQKYGDLQTDGVCGSRIAEKLGFSLPTVSRHMKQLVDSGLVESKRIKQWTFYRLRSSGLERARHIMDEAI